MIFLTVFDLGDSTSLRGKPRVSRADEAIPSLRSALGIVIL